MKRPNLAASSVVVVVLLASTGVRADLNDGELGGPPSNPASALCPEGSVVVGVTGTTVPFGEATIVESIAVDCEEGASGSGSIGVPNGAPAFSTCSEGQVAVGIVGREGDLIDQFALRCRAADLTGSTDTAGSFGGDGGQADGPYDCEDGLALVGMEGSTVVLDVLPLARHVVIACGKRNRVFEDGFESP